MFLEFKHGGHALAKDTKDKDRHARGRADIVAPAQTGEDFDPNTMTPFRYLLDEVGQNDLLPVSAATVEALDALGTAMVDQAPPPSALDANPDSDIPPIYTYWSQFIDHELTARTDRDGDGTDITADAPDLKPVPRASVEYRLLNRRTPALELDCLYGDGPPGRHGDKARRAGGRNLALARKLRDGAKMRIGTAGVTNRPTGEPAGPVPPPTHDLHRDLPRIGALLDLGVVKQEDFPQGLAASATFRQRAFIGDPRNDENLAIAQFHVAMLRFHNAVVDWLRFKDPRHEKRNQEELFEDARKVVRWTFQWLVVNDFLPTLLRPDIVDKVVEEKARLYGKQLREVKEPYMPVEFSVACYRFGHSMIRNSYDYNRNFGRKPDGTSGFLAPVGTLDNFFQFTGKSQNPFLGLAKTLPHNWIIEWERFDGSAPKGESQVETTDRSGNPVTVTVPARVARKIDTHLAPSLGTLLNEGSEGGLADRITALLKHLARRNLRRGYQLSLPTGQALARAFGASALTHDELKHEATDAVTQALEQGGFLERTPLWYYILKEAEVRDDGQRLGKVGSRVVAETIIGVLATDPESYLAQDPHWDPSKPTPGAGGPLKLADGRTIKKIGDLLEFAGVKPPAV